MTNLEFSTEVITKRIDPDILSIGLIFFYVGTLLSIINLLYVVVHNITFIK